MAHQICCYRSNTFCAPGRRINCNQQYSCLAWGGSPLIRSFPGPPCPSSSPSLDLPSPSPRPLQSHPEIGDERRRGTAWRWRCRSSRTRLPRRLRRIRCGAPVAEEAPAATTRRPRRSNGDGEQRRAGRDVMCFLFSHTLKGSRWEGCFLKKVNIYR